MLQAWGLTVSTLSLPTSSVVPTLVSVGFMQDAAVSCNRVEFPENREAVRHHVWVIIAIP